eukprot:jgi/Tetstr1/423374/TSEL_014061.t1
MEPWMLDPVLCITAAAASLGALPCRRHKPPARQALFSAPDLRHHGNSTPAPDWGGAQVDAQEQDLDEPSEESAPGVDAGGASGLAKRQAQVAADRTRQPVRMLRDRTGGGRAPAGVHLFCFAAEVFKSGGASPYKIWLFALSQDARGWLEECYNSGTYFEFSVELADMLHDRQFLLLADDQQCWERIRAGKDVFRVTRKLYGHPPFENLLERGLAAVRTFGGLNKEEKTSLDAVQGMPCISGAGGRRVGTRSSARRPDLQLLVAKWRLLQKRSSLRRPRVKRDWGNAHAAVQVQEEDLPLDVTARGLDAPAGADAEPPAQQPQVPSQGAAAGGDGSAPPSAAPARLVRNTPSTDPATSFNTHQAAELLCGALQPEPHQPLRRAKRAGGGGLEPRPPKSTRQRHAALATGGGCEDGDDNSSDDFSNARNNPAAEHRGMSMDSRPVFETSPEAGNERPEVQQIHEHAAQAGSGHLQSKQDSDDDMDDFCIVPATAWTRERLTGHDAGGGQDNSGMPPDLRQPHTAGAGAAAGGAASIQQQHDDVAQTGGGCFDSGDEGRTAPTNTAQAFENAPVDNQDTVNRHSSRKAPGSKAAPDPQPAEDQQLHKGAGQLVGGCLDEGDESDTSCADVSRSFGADTADGNDKGDQGDLRPSHAAAPGAHSLHAAGQQTPPSPHADMPPPENIAEEAPAMDALQRFSLVGLPNVGNSCYMNSTLQMLATILPFREKIIRRYAQNRQCPTQCLGAEVQRSVARHVLHGDLTGQQLRSLRNSMYENSGGSFVKPENGSPWPQEDANECLQILLKGLVATECSVCQLQLADLCKIEIAQVVKCKGCGAESKSVQELTSMQLPIPRGCTSQQDALQAFMADEDIDGYECNREGQQWFAMDDEAADTVELGHVLGKESQSEAYQLVYVLDDAVRDNAVRAASGVAVLGNPTLSKEGGAGATQKEWTSNQDKTANHGNSKRPDAAAAATTRAASQPVEGHGMPQGSGEDGLPPRSNMMEAPREATGQSPVHDGPIHAEHAAPGTAQGAAHDPSWRGLDDGKMGENEGQGGSEGAMPVPGGGDRAGALGDVSSRCQPPVNAARAARHHPLVSAGAASQAADPRARPAMPKSPNVPKNEQRQDAAAGAINGSIPTLDSMVEPALYQGASSLRAWYDAFGVQGHRDCSRKLARWVFAVAVKGKYPLDKMTKLTQLAVRKTKAMDLWDTMTSHNETVWGLLENINEVVVLLNAWKENEETAGTDHLEEALHELLEEFVA